MSAAYRTDRMNILALQYPDSGKLSTDVPDVDTGIDWLVYLAQYLFFASTFSSKMQIEFLKVAWGISPLLHFLRRHSFGCRRGAVAGIQSLLVTDM